MGEVVRIEDTLRRSAYDKAAVGISIMDANGAFLDANRMFCSICGYKVTEIRRTTIADLLHSDDVDAVMTGIRSVQSGACVVYEADKRCVPKRGEMAWVHLIVSVLRSDRKNSHCIVTLQNITHRKRIERDIVTVNANLERRVLQRTKELRSANEKLRREMKQRAMVEEANTINLLRLTSVVSTLPFGVVMTDERLRLQNINRAFGDLFRMKKDPSLLIGKSVKDLRRIIGGQTVDAAQYARVVEETLLLQRPVFGSEFLLKDGRTISRDYLPIHIGRKYRGHLWLYRDITKQKISDRAKSEFMSLASHQLRTPLTTIRWSFGRMMRKEGLRPDLRSLLNTAKGATVQMASTINAMLRVSQIEEGDVRIRRSVFSLERLLSSVVEECTAKRSTHSIPAITIKCATELTLRTDRMLLHEVLSILVNNALKYTPVGKSIWIRARQSRRGVLIAVQDEGLGIPRYQQSRVFQKFFRADNAMEREPDGNGLGLYLVRLITTLLQSDISFESEEMYGTTFTLFFPASPGSP